MGNTINRKATYIISVVKSAGKSLDYALSIVCWYSMTDKEDIEISEAIKSNWNN